MNEPNQTEILAAEYALGTLDQEEREQVNVRRQTEPDLDAAIMDWELRLVPLTDQISEQAPDGNLLPEILKRIERGVEPGYKPVQNSAVILDLRKKLKRWKQIAAATALLAASLSAIMIYRGPTEIKPTQNYVAVFNKDDQQPAFLLSIDLDSRALSIQAIDAEPQPEKTYQLWILEENIGPTPQSLGLLNAVGTPTEKSLEQFDVEVLKTATYGISIEPPGGSPTGKPSPGAIHGFLYPVDDD